MKRHKLAQHNSKEFLFINCNFFCQHLSFDQHLSYHKCFPNKTPSLTVDTLLTSIDELKADEMDSEVEKSNYVNEDTNNMDKLRPQNSNDEESFDNRMNGVAIKTEWVCWKRRWKVCALLGYEYSKGRITRGLTGKFKSNWKYYQVVILVLYDKSFF